jgi:hypothetical protein
MARTRSREIEITAMETFGTPDTRLGGHDLSRIQPAVQHLLLLAAEDEGRCAEMSPSVRQTMRQAADSLARPRHIDPAVPIKVGSTSAQPSPMIMITDENGKPLAAANKFADVVRDGIVWVFAGAMAVVRELKDRLEAATGRTLSTGSVTIPPGVSISDGRAHHYVLEGVGIECTAVSTSRLRRTLCSVSVTGQWSTSVAGRPGSR